MITAALLLNELGAGTKEKWLTDDDSFAMMAASLLTDGLIRSFGRLLMMFGTVSRMIYAG